MIRFKHKATRCSHYAVDHLRSVSSQGHNLPTFSLQPSMAWLGYGLTRLVDSSRVQCQRSTPCWPCHPRRQGEQRTGCDPIDQNATGHPVTSETTLSIIVGNMNQLSLRSFALDSHLQEQLTLLMAPEARKSDVSEDESLTKQSAPHDVVGLGGKIYTCCQSLAAYLMLERITYCNWIQGLC